MKFGQVPVAQAQGGIAVHSIRKAGMVLKKGTAIGEAEIAALRAAGVAEIVVARLEPDDVPEDVAAAEIAAAVAGEGPASIAPSRGAPISSPRSRACWWSTRMRSTASIWSTS